MDIYHEIITNWIGPIFMVVLAFFTLMLIKEQQWMKAVSLLGVGAIVFIFITEAPSLIGGNGSLTKGASKVAGEVGDDNTSTVKNEVKKKAVEKTATGSTPTHIDWNLIGAVGACILLAIVLLAAASLAYRYTKNKQELMVEENKRKLEEQRKAAELDKKLTYDWGELTKLHETIKNNWGSYDKDISKLLRLPAMRDYSLPEVGAVIDSLDEAELAKTLHYPKGIETIAVTDYYKYVKASEKAFDDAVKAAEQHRDKVMSFKERRQLKLAQQLLTTALDNTSSPNERQLAYERVTAIMEDLRINVPAPITLQIEADTRKLLEA